MAAATLMASALFAHSAMAQNATAPATPQVSAPAAATPPAARPATPTATPGAPVPTAAAPVSAAPVANGTVPATQGAPANPESPAAAGPQPGEPAIGGDLLPSKLSYWGMVKDADWLVQVVMAGLAFASLVTWTVFIAKSLELRAARAEVRRGLRILLNAPTLAEARAKLRDGTGAVAQLMQAAAQEIMLSAGVRGDGLKERIALQLERLEMASSRRISRGTGVLATIGSTAPFVGLFGTVWGIMNSFIGISNAHTTNLAVVAPGIAQALMATAFGLIAAIPAVMVYNVLARQTTQYRGILGDASAQVMRLVSRDLDRARLPLAAAAE